ncbi:MAG: ribosomal RNA small subunit methyltransferase A [Planctomycetia bacterium]|nr:ribosomal RNA small subunit methyltransferase A [Planctomycetia bacterium]
MRAVEGDWVTCRFSAPPARQTTAYLKRLFAQVGFTIDPRHGQNFLVDLNLLDLLERAAGVTAADVVLEVGSGTGTLTERLARTAGRVVSCEIDPRLAQLARERLLSVDHAGGGLDERVEIVEGDVLASKHRFAPAVLAAVARACAARPDGRFRLVANLPYCVATPVISNLLATPRPFDTATVTVQREMAERMTASAGTSSYNALSVWVGAQCRGEIVRILPPSVFWPRPKVESAIVHLVLDPGRRAAIPDLGRFHDFVRDVFCHRRKLLRGVLVRLAGGKQNDAAREVVARVYATMGFDESVRAEEIPPADFVRLEQAFFERGPR